mmetsp:Transcript_37494/g.49720  ORF Transcript_37494/g.49720 Transcript_37494/m.49720 type:complete len:89 (-) Transcript_37494:6-272(-)
MSKQDNDMEIAMKKRESLIRALHKQEEETRIASMNERAEICSLSKKNGKFESNMEADRRKILNAIERQKKEIETLLKSVTEISRQTSM